MGEFFHLGKGSYTTSSTSGKRSVSKIIELTFCKGLKTPLLFLPFKNTCRLNIKQLFWVHWECEQLVHWKILRIFICFKAQEIFVSACAFFYPCISELRAIKLQVNWSECKTKSLNYNNVEVHNRLKSRELSAQKPKFAIWEVWPYFPLCAKSGE